MYNVRIPLRFSQYIALDNGLHAGSIAATDVTARRETIQVVGVAVQQLHESDNAASVSSIH